MTASESASFIPAPHGLRAAAWLIDAAIVLAVFAFLPQPVSYLLLLALFVAYHAALVWLLRTTVGKALLGLEVRRVGAAPGPLWSLGRAAIGYLVVDVMGLGLLPALFTRSRRCLHDIVFGSVVAFEGVAQITLRTMATRLVAFAEAHKEAVDRRKKFAVALLTFWGFLVGLGRALQAAIDILAGVKVGAAPAASTSIIGVVSTKAAVAVAAAATVANGALYQYVPVVHTTVNWLAAPRYIGVTARLSGRVTNAVDQQPLAGATVRLLDGTAAEATDSPRMSTTTDGDGIFVFDAPPGDYTVVTSRPGFADAIVTSIALASEGASAPAVALSPVQAEGQLRIVLTWGAAPADLDAHLVAAGQDGTVSRVNYNAKGNAAAFPYAVLDVDDQDSNGPETITIHQQVAASYCYSVHDYSSTGSAPGGALRDSGARVDVYGTNALRTSFTVPQSDGTLWTVFRMIDGEIVPVNGMSYGSPEACE